ncbi:uncharacterized protein LOC106086182 [Stomoxys calcitrans]|uniref:uncharacterized protein LOC106086182 n=1 Tax=Stomoxys calcitrans TaxID=35570 RepID=UPI0027E38731|nr:uncharacterized protein LOC106086182 [Stomoxys calcitrans]XP_013106190.2 uncharacterized protein LOC106086182 [Stomoxys calcitrans]XP_013106191.2 uncharacterized protein LOC106086182 [Stomoxys calcitrans]XP_013106193.2 uncharacterized protein LOC106086182 [Stomoxys calcitrans]XP_013106194.2 uncharacterized protein LOC106086182 [Stomoxys calcitrans]XP_013106195.2 uncharacterized protein LOC106086182 [Stomoxys calcitrans]XP_013106196.2 uncharacterized protein LOC106086182 [Stomoxys calcitran
MTPDITNKTKATTATVAAVAGTTSLAAGRTIKSSGPTATSSISPLSPSTRSTSSIKRHLLTIEKLRNRVRQILKCVINLHIDILVIESNVNQLIDDVKELNADLMECQRLDNLIQTLRDYNGPTICHEWPFPLVNQGTIDEADLAQSLNSKELLPPTAK